MDEDKDKKDSEIEYSEKNLDDSVVEEEGSKEMVKKLREKLKEAVAQKQEYLTNWQKDKAEFLNARKRDKEEKENFIKFANENLITDLLPVLQSFELAFGNKEAWEKVDKNWRVGVEFISNQLKKALEDNGLREVNPLGEKFDPMRDEMLAYEHTDDPKKEHLITEVVNKGYNLNGKTIKAPRVKVGELKK